MTRQDDEPMQSDPPAVGAWLAAVAFVLIVVGALLYGASR
jgi:hypothetical protein